MQIYVNVYGAFIVLNPTGSLLIVCSLSLFFTFLLICCLSFVCVCVCFPSSLQYVYAFRDESSRKIMEGKSL